MTTTDERREWADSHGYRHYTCRACGWSGYTDGDPRYECYCPPPDEESDESDGT